MYIEIRKGTMPPRFVLDCRDGRYQCGCPEGWNSSLSKSPVFAIEQAWIHYQLNNGEQQALWPISDPSKKL